MIDNTVEPNLKNKKIVEFLLSIIFSNHELTMPLYCGFIRSTACVDELHDILPLVYIWNENEADQSFTVSINGSIIGALLEKVIPRSSLDFMSVRDEVLSVLQKAMTQSIVTTCEKFDAMPSIVFSGTQ
jgi:hypothetical protein